MYIICGAVIGSFLYNLSILHANTHVYDTFTYWVYGRMTVWKWAKYAVYTRISSHTRTHLPSCSLKPFSHYDSKIHSLYALLNLTKVFTSVLPVHTFTIYYYNAYTCTLIYIQYPPVSLWVPQKVSKCRYCLRIFGKFSDPSWHVPVHTPVALQWVIHCHNVSLLVTHCNNVSHESISAIMWVVHEHI